MRESTFITHDFGARNDPKMMRLQMKMGGQGLAIFWCLVEILWENGGYAEYDPEAIAFTLRWASADEVQRVITEFNLFQNDGTRFWSQSALDRIELKREAVEKKSQQGRENVSRRWKKNNQEDTPVIQPEYDCNTPVIQPEYGSDTTFFLSLFLSINLSFIFKNSEEEKEKILAYFFFKKGAVAPNKEAAKFIAFNNNDGRRWDDMSEETRRKAFNAWEQQPPQRKRFGMEFLKRWAAFCDALASSGAPWRIQMAAMADGIKYEADGGTFRLWCPDCLRDWVEHHIPDAGAALMSVANGEGCDRIAYRKCVESVKP